MNDADIGSWYDAETQLRWLFLGTENDALRKQFFEDQTLAHYTTAENAINILAGEVWLRNTRVMNDFAEIQHGHSMIRKALEADQGSGVEPALKRIGRLLDCAHSGISAEAFQAFEATTWNLMHRTHVTCLSVHNQAKEKNGRLSMWRAYTGNYAGVALVLNPEPFTQLVEDPSFFSVPVIYDDEDQLKSKLHTTASGLEKNISFLAAQPREIIFWYFTSLLRRIATASKHAGFAEEQEWRVMHTRKVDPDDGLTYSVEKIRGIPQIVTKLSLRSEGPFAGRGLTIPNLLREVIIGPTNYPYVVAEALQSAMEAAGVPEAGNKIRISQIPLRMEI